MTVYLTQRIDARIKKGDYKAVVANLLKPEGLNYGQLPKGLLQFHEYLVSCALCRSLRGSVD